MAVFELYGNIVNTGLISDGTMVTADKRSTITVNLTNGKQIIWTDLTSSGKKTVLAAITSNTNAAVVDETVEETSDDTASTEASSAVATKTSGAKKPAFVG